MPDPYITENPPDLYADVPLYGRYKAKDSDSLFKDLNPEDLYDLCTSDSEMIPGFSEGRRVYAIGGVIVKGRHLESGVRISHEYGDANEVAAIKLVQERFPWIPVPTIYFQGKVRLLFDREVTKSRSMATIS